MGKYTVIFEDGTIAYVKAWDKSEAYEKALDIKSNSKIIEVFLD